MNRLLYKAVRREAQCSTIQHCSVGTHASPNPRTLHTEARAHNLGWVHTNHSSHNMRTQAHTRRTLGAHRAYANQDECSTQCSTIQHCSVAVWRTPYRKSTCEANRNQSVTTSLCTVIKTAATTRTTMHSNTISSICADVRASKHPNNKQVQH